MSKLIDKTLNILEVFISNQTEYSLIEIARLTGLNITTANRIILKLVKRGYLEQLQPRGKYSLGMKFLDFSGIIKYRIQIVHDSLPFLTILSKKVNESAMLTLKKGPQTLVISTVATNHVLRTDVEEGGKFPLYCTGVGKAVLSSMNDEELEKYYKNNEIIGYTPKTITDFSDLKKNLLKAKEEGFAFDVDERIIGVSNIASVIRNDKGEVIGSVGVLGPSVRLTLKKIREIAPYVKDCAQEISRAIGYRGEF
jgi:IclR family KDG regulon transcriptional repressor